MHGVAPEDLDLDFRPRRRPGIGSVELDGEAVLFDEATQALHQLNPTATLLWGLFDGDLTLGELVAELAEASGADREVVEADVLQLARELGKQGLLEGVAQAHEPTTAEPTETDPC